MSVPLSLGTIRNLRRKEHRRRHEQPTPGPEQDVQAAAIEEQQEQEASNDERSRSGDAPEVDSRVGSRCHRLAQSLRQRTVARCQGHCRGELVRGLQRPEPSARRDPALDPWSFLGALPTSYHSDGYGNSRMLVGFNDLPRVAETQDVGSFAEDGSSALTGKLSDTAGTAPAAAATAPPRRSMKPRSTPDSPHCRPWHGPMPARVKTLTWFGPGWPDRGGADVGGRHLLAAAHDGRIGWRKHIRPRPEEPVQERPRSSDRALPAQRRRAFGRLLERIAAEPSRNADGRDFAGEAGGLRPRDAARVAGDGDAFDAGLPPRIEPRRKAQLIVRQSCAQPSASVMWTPGTMPSWTSSTGVAIDPLRPDRVR